MTLLNEFRTLLNFTYLGLIIDATYLEQFRNEVSQILEIAWMEKMHRGQKKPIVFNNSLLSKLR